MKLYERIENNNFDEIDKNRAIELIEGGNGHLVYNEDYFKLQKENEKLRAKWDRDTHILQNKLDYANADRIDLAQQNKELRKENEELKYKIKGQECVIETQVHNEEVYESIFEKLEKENKELKKQVKSDVNTIF